jgi:TRAP-type mannitol/chloroaromatic compound transport system substrate-binding protein
MGAAVNALPGGEIVPAMDRGLLDAAEFNNATSDRLLGFPDVSKICMLQSYHQSAETFEIMFNKPKYDALPAKMKAIIANAVRSRLGRHVVEGDRPLLEGLHRAAGPRTRSSSTRPRTPCCRSSSRCGTQIMEKKSAENPLFKEIAASQRAFAERAVKWDQDVYVSRRMAVSHFFGAKKAHPPRRPEELRGAVSNVNHPGGPGG